VRPIRRAGIGIGLQNAAARFNDQSIKGAGEELMTAVDLDVGELTAAQGRVLEIFKVCCFLVVFTSIC
jgi:hypothetical protein